MRNGRENAPSPRVLHFLPRHGVSLSADRAPIGSEGRPYQCAGKHLLTPADVYFGRAGMIAAERQLIKREPLKHKRLQHHLQAAQTLTQMSQSLPPKTA